MSKKFYAVRNGRKIGIFNTWDECSSYVKGYKGAEYKSFKTKEEAELYVKNQERQIFDLNKNKIKDNELIAYVDGSYNQNTKVFGYGVVIIDVNGEHTFNGFDDNEKYIDHRNVAGEIYGSIEAIKYAMEKGKSKIYLHFDYMGIKAWALGEWKTNKELTQKYKKFIDLVNSKIDIDFIKVKAHSNDKYNDMADKLAKESVGVEI